MSVRVVVLVAVVGVAAACGGESATPTPTDSGPADSVAVESSAATTTAASSPPTASTLPPTSVEAADDAALVTEVDFAKEPFITFAPVPPAPSGSSLPLPDGAVDFHDLFVDPEPWADALASLDAFKIHSWMIRHYLTDDELVRMSDFLNEHGVALIVEAEPLDPPDPSECVHQESFEGPYEIENAARLRDLGIELGAYAIEQPFSYGHKLIGEGACNYELDRVLDQVVEWAEELRALYPGIPIGSIEALWERPPTVADDFALWIDAWTAAMGEPPAFQHVDVNWAIPDWPDTLTSIEEVVESRGVPFGPLYNGFTEGTNDEWITRVMDHVAIYEHEWGGSPGQVTIQSWYPQPDRLLPDTDVNAMTSLVNRYLGARPVVADVARADGFVSGRLVDADGQPLDGLPVELVQQPAGGARQPMVVAGEVPANAANALAMVRVNVEDSLGVTADALVHEVAYTEGGGASVVPNGGFGDGPVGWGIYDDNVGSAAVVADDGDGAMRLVANADERILVDGSTFPVTPGAEYRFVVDATVADGSSHGTIGLGFLDASGAEFERIVVDLVAVPEVLATTTAGPGGEFSFDVAAVATGVALEIETPGDARTRPAHAPVAA